MKAAELNDLKNIPVSFTLGSFDGLHKGHAILLNVLKNESLKNCSRSLVISFYPHPRQIVDSAFNLKLLNDRKEKLEILEAYGIDFIHFINFTKDFAKTDYFDFYENYIFKNLLVTGIIAGRNHGFGKNRNGTSELLNEICTRHSVDLVSVEPLIYKNKPISSTRIRNCLLEGNVAEANLMLGYEYSIEGIVEKGKGIGKELGFHTANISLAAIEKVVPGNGVYLTKINVEGSTYFGISDAGYSPTMGDPDSPLLLETHIFDFDRNIYGRTVKVSFLDKLRDEIKFQSIKDLKIAIEKDLKNAKFQLNKFREDK